MSYYEKEEVMNEATLAADSTIPTTLGGTECDVINLTECGDLSLTIEATFGPDNTGNVVAHVKSSADGGATTVNDWDTVDYCEIVVPCTVDSRVQVTKPIDGDPKYMKVQVVNEDDTYGVGTVIVTKVTSKI